jgi:hypothetical protein
LVEKLQLWPPELDVFIEAAGQDSDRTPAEELLLQRSYAALTEMWIFALLILDPEKDWLHVVTQNLAKNVRYCYFTANADRFKTLLDTIQRTTALDSEVLMDRLECILVPSEFFVTNFAIYNPGRPDMYGCGTKAAEGKAESFYTMPRSETERLHQLLFGWRRRLAARATIPLTTVRRIYPPEARVECSFVSDSRDASSELENKA